MNAIGQLAVVAAISFAAAGATYLVRGGPARQLVCDRADLKPDEVCLEDVREPVVWIDARSRKAWEKDGLAGSLLWNIDPAEDQAAFEVGAVAAIVENPKVVVYCDDENCGISRQVAEQVRNLGVGAEVKVLRGGWRALSEAGRISGSN